MKTEKTDRLAMHLFRALLDADHQTNNNPCVFFRYLKTGLQNYLDEEGFSQAVTQAIEIADAKVSIACFNLDMESLANRAMAAARGPLRSGPCKNPTHRHSKEAQDAGNESQQS